MPNANRKVSCGRKPPLKKLMFIRNRFLVVFVIILCPLITLPAFGQTTSQSLSGPARYVSANGSDSSDGLSWSNAKKTISGAEKSCPPSGSCTINVSSLVLSSPLELNRPDTAVQCAAGAIIKTAVTGGAPIVVTANNLQITGCTFQYSSGEGSTVVLIPHSVSHVTIVHNVFRNYLGRPSWAGIIRVGNRTNRNASTAVTDVRITDNQFLNVDPDAINLQDDVFRATISNNVVVTDVSKSSSPTINAQTSDAGTSLETISVLNNSISKGTHNNCIQIQALALGNSTIQNVIVNGNTCSLQMNAGAGRGATGYSMAGIASLKETRNVFEGHGQTIAGNAPFEIVTCSQATSSHNVARLGGVSTAVMDAFTVIGNRYAVMRDVALTGDSVYMAMHGPAHGSCFHVYAGQEAQVEGVTMTGNTCNLSGSTATGALRGIWIQSNGRGAVIQGGTISGNVITGATRAAVLGIHLEHDEGTISGWRIERNQFRNTRRNIVGNQGGRR